MIGSPGAGKSSVGRAIAERLGVDFRDFDELMQAEHGLPAGELVVEFGRERFQELEVALREVMDLSPSGIRRHLDLNKPIYAKTSAYGHFGRKAGRDGSFSWEKVDLVPKLKAAIR